MSPPPDDDPPPHGDAIDRDVAGRAGSPRREQMLSELAAELRAARDEHRRDITRLRTDLSGLSTLVGDNADLLGRIVPRVNTLDTQLVELAERLDMLFVRSLATRGHDEDDSGDDGQGPVTASGGADGAAAPIDWPSLTAAAAELEWQALGDWVAAVLGPFYELTRAQLPDCWPRHRPAVIELVWLRRTYIAAHTAGAAPAAAADWHTRWRRDALANIAAAIPDTWCRPGEHYVDRWSTHKPAGGPPPPPPPPHQPGQRPGPEQHKTGIGGEIATPQHWGPHFQAAAGADITWRRQRETGRRHGS